MLYDTFLLPIFTNHWNKPLIKVN